MEARFFGGALARRAGSLYNATNGNLDEGRPPLMLPGYVKDDAGHLEPFEPDRLYRRLFAATEAAGYADPLAARELTDSVLHFLARDGVGLIIDLGDLTTRVQTVLRELRHAPVVAALAEAQTASTDAEYGWSFPATAPLSSLEAEKLTYRCYGRALGLAQEFGLLTIDALGDAEALAALVTRLPSPGSPALEQLEAWRGYVAHRLIFDSPDLDGVLRGWWPEPLDEFLKELAWASAIHGLVVESHLNLPDPPWGELAAGPLFRGQVDPVDRLHRDALWTVCTRAAALGRERLWSGLKVIWHSTTPTTQRSELNASTSSGDLSFPIDFAFDTPGKVGFGCGLSRQRRALLMVIDLHLPVLWRRQRSPLAPERFIGKVQSLARLAASAGTQKRDRLRQLWGGDGRFHLEASHVHLRLRGLEEVMKELAPPSPARLCQHLRRRLKRTLKEEGQLRSLPFTFELLGEHRV